MQNAYHPVLSCIVTQITKIYANNIYARYINVQSSFSPLQCNALGFSCCLTLTKQWNIWCLPLFTRLKLLNMENGDCHAFLTFIAQCPLFTVQCLPQDIYWFKMIAARFQLKPCWSHKYNCPSKLMTRTGWKTEFQSGDAGRGFSSTCCTLPPLPLL